MDSPEDPELPPPPPLPPPLPVEEEASQLPPLLPKPFPGFWQAAGLFVLWILMTVVVIVPAMILDMIRHNEHKEFTMHPVTLGLATLLASTTVLWVARRRTGRGLAELFAWVPVDPSVFTAAAGLVAGILPLGILTFLWLERLFPGIVPKLDYGFSKSRWFAFVVIVFIAPFCEETVFRGIFLRGFEGRYGASKAIALSAALFGLAHGSLVRLPHTFALGCALGWLYSKTRSLWVSVAAHMLNNLIAGLFLLAGGGGGGGLTPAPVKKPIPFHPVEPVLALTALAILLISIRSLRQQQTFRTIME